MNQKMIDTPNQMTGVWLTGHGGPEKLVYKNDIPVPLPGSGDVLIKVSAAGVNNTDINTRTGWYSKTSQLEKDASWSGQPIQFPLIQGCDVCGYIVGVGKGVSKNRIGERVLVEPCLTYSGGKLLKAPVYLGSECDGGFAEYTAISTHHAHKINSSLSDTELASFPCSYSTAQNLLDRANVKKNEFILVTGASGGVGSAVLQIAHTMGAHVAAASKPSKFTAIKRLGAEVVFDRKENLYKKFGKNRFDAVIDLVAGPSWPQFLEVLKPGGRYAVAGAIAGPLVELDLRTLYLKDLLLMGCTRLSKTIFKSLVQLIEQNKIIPLIAKEFDLSKIHEAQEMFARKRHIGKIVLNV